jgi:predicted XRE-type DNA-binding protein
MDTATRSRSLEIEMTASRLFAQVFQAYLECDTRIQQVIKDMVAIINDPEADADDRAMAEATIHEALFPVRSPADGFLGVDLEEEEVRAHIEEAEVQAELDREEQTFACRVEALLEERDWSQGQLAEAIGVKQPAVSLLLSRRARPQRRTVEKIASALGVPPAQLWPEFDAK